MREKKAIFSNRVALSIIFAAIGGTSNAFAQLPDPPPEPSEIFIEGGEEIRMVGALAGQVFIQDGTLFIADDGGFIGPSADFDPAPLFDSGDLLRVTGNVFFGPNGALKLLFRQTQSESLATKLSVSGMAELNGRLLLVPLETISGSGTLEVISSEEGLHGTFAEVILVTSQAGQIDAALDQTATTLSVVVEAVPQAVNQGQGGTDQDEEKDPPRPGDDDVFVTDPELFVANADTIANDLERDQISDTLEDVFDEPGGAALLATGRGYEGRRLPFAFRASSPYDMALRSVLDRLSSRPQASSDASALRALPGGSEALERLNDLMQSGTIRLPPFYAVETPRDLEAAIAAIGGRGALAGTTQGYLPLLAAAASEVYSPAVFRSLRDQARAIPGLSKDGIAGLSDGEVFVLVVRHAIQSARRRMVRGGGASLIGAASGPIALAMRPLQGEAESNRLAKRFNLRPVAPNTYAFVSLGGSTTDDERGRRDLNSDAFRASLGVHHFLSPKRMLTAALSYNRIHLDDFANFQKSRTNSYTLSLSLKQVLSNRITVHGGIFGGFADVTRERYSGATARPERWTFGASIGASKKIKLTKKSALVLGSALMASNSMHQDDTDTDGLFIEGRSDGFAKMRFSADYQHKVTKRLSAALGGGMEVELTDPSGGAGRMTGDISARLVGRLSERTSLSAGLAYGFDGDGEFDQISGTLKFSLAF